MFEKFWKKIIRRKRFSYLSLLAFFLWLMSIIYRFLFCINRKFKKTITKLSTPVISVGNITVGGTGKTPVVALLARFLIDEGFRVGIVSSGYGRSDRTSFINPGYKTINMNQNQTGDEVMHLAQLLPEAIFSVDDSKSEAALALDKDKSVDVVIVDDAFQHFNLHRDIDLVTFDAGIDEAHLKPFPYGVMRESIKSLKRADIIIITRSKFAHDLARLQSELKAINPQAKHFHARFTATEIIGRNQNHSIKYLEDKSLFLFAGIGNFKSLKRQVKALCADLDYALELDDHQKYDIDILKDIKRQADKYESDIILTTGKDWVKIQDFDFGREFYYLNQTIDLDPGEEKLISHLVAELKLKKQAD